jgi:hypothetical protein
MRGLAWGVMALALVAACSGTAVPAIPARISGRWGGPGIQLGDSVAAQSVVLSNPCFRDLFPAPILVDESGSFSAQGTVVWATWSPAIGYAIQITGSVAGHTMQLAEREMTAQGEWGSYVHFALTQGQSGDFSGWACPA